MTPDTHILIDRDANRLTVKQERDLFPTCTGVTASFQPDGQPPIDLGIVQSVTIAETLYDGPIPIPEPKEPQR